MHPTRRLRLLPLVLVLVACTYPLQLVRPLHLESDSVCYLLTAEKVAAGEANAGPGPRKPHCALVYPPGYPAVLSTLIRTGWAVAWSFVILNLFSLGVGLVAAYHVCRRGFGLDANRSLAACALTLLSYPVFRYVNMPLSDFVFFGLALVSVLVLVWASSLNGWRRYGVIGLATILAGLATLTRTVGIALIPAIIRASLGGRTVHSHLRGVLKANNRGLVIGIGAVALLIVAGTAFLLLTRSDYVRVDLRVQYGQRLLATLVRTLGYHITEVGELTANAPAAKLPEALRFFVPPLGVIGLGAVAYCVWRRRANLGSVEAFVLSYMVIIFLWPFSDVRFWIPILPWLVAWILWSLGQVELPRAARLVLVAYVSLFCLLGLIGQAYNTRISLSGRDFATFFQDEYLGPVYRTAWGAPRQDDSVKADTAALRVLRTYEPRVRSFSHGQDR
jgi:hypothetical protein